jgi:hypothetical protein
MSLKKHPMPHAKAAKGATENRLTLNSAPIRFHRLVTQLVPPQSASLRPSRPLREVQRFRDDGASMDCELGTGLASAREFEVFLAPPRHPIVAGVGHFS